MAGCVAYLGREAKAAKEKAKADATAKPLPFLFVFISLELLPFKLQFVFLRLFRSLLRSHQVSFHLIHLQSHRFFRSLRSRHVLCCALL